MIRLVRRVDLVVPVLVVLGLLVFLGPALLGRGVLLDVNWLSSRLPFRALTGAVYADTITCRQDTIDYLPAIAQIRASLFAGSLPTWGPYEVGGAPLAALPNTGFMTPLALPYFVLPLWLAPAFVKLLEIVVALAGMILFLRRRGVSVAGAWLAGFVFVTSGFMIVWSNWPQTRVAALIPLLMWAVDRVVDRHRVKDAVILAAVFAAMLLGGFPAVTVFALLVAAVFALVRVWTLYRDRWREAVGALAMAAGGLGLGLGLAAVQIVPFVANLSAVLAERDKGGAQLPVSAAVTLLDPTARGDCRGGVWFGGIIPIEAIGYVGAGALALAVLGIAVRRRRREEPGVRAWLLGCLVVAALLIWVGPPLLWVWERLPVIGNNSIIRAQSVVGFLLACLAGLGFDRLIRRGEVDGPVEDGDDAVNQASKRPIVTVIIAVVVLLVVVGAAVLDARRDEYLVHLVGSLVFPILLLLSAAVVIALVHLGAPRLAIWGALLIAVMVVVQGAQFAHTMLPLSDRELMYPETPTHEFLQANIGHDRYGAGDRTMDASISDWYHLRSPTGHEFTDPRWKDLLRAVDRDVQRSPTYSAFSSSLDVEDMAGSRILDRLAVRYWTANPRRGVGKVGRVSDSGRVRLTEDQPASCEVDAGPLRGIRLYLAEQMPAAAPGTIPTLHVRVTAGGETRTGSALLDGSDLGPGPIRIAVAGEDLPRRGRAEVQVSLTGTDQPRYFAGDAPQLSCRAVQPDGDTDQLRLVFSDAGGAVYERLDALPRIRWASTSRVVDPERQVAELTAGVPNDTVLLDDASSPPARGGTGSVGIAADDPERIVVDTESTGQGYLVVADSIVRPGWVATVDGEPVQLVRGDHALAALPVPAGRHRVELVYTAPGLRAGVAVSVVSVVVVVILLGLPPLLRRRRQ